jgi:hypothetical protein
MRGCARNLPRTFIYSHDIPKIITEQENFSAIMKDHTVIAASVITRSFPGK